MISGVAGLAHQLRPLVFRLYYMVRRQTPQLQLTLTQGSVLAELQGGTRRMSELAELESVRLPSMTNVVARLERAGLVYREPDFLDRRAVLVQGTEEGSRFYDELVLAREDFLRERLAGLAAEDQAAIDTALPALRRLLEPPLAEHMNHEEELVSGER